MTQVTFYRFFSRFYIHLKKQERPAFLQASFLLLLYPYNSQFPGNSQQMFGLPAEMLCALRRLRISGFCTGSFDKLGDPAGVLKHRTGLEHVVVERLCSVVSHEERAL